MEKEMRSKKVYKVRPTGVVLLRFCLRALEGTGERSTKEETEGTSLEV